MPVTVIDALNARSARGEKSLSYEFFPPKDEAAEATLWATFETLASVGADFVSVTYGAGGSSQDRTLAVTERMAPQITTIGHLTCVGSTREHSSEIIRSFEDHGVASILALRGDAPKDRPNALAEGELKTAIELVELVKASSSLEVGVAAFPEKHGESPSLAHDAEVLRLKQTAGADYAITQLFFTLDAYLELLAENAKAGATLPIIPGLMTISNAKQVLRMAEMSNAKVPQGLYEQLIDADDATAKRIGMDYTIELGVKLLEVGAPGLHIFTLNQSTAALELARGVGLVR
ncbi:MAG: methylenetetrahydrofolate reductase [Micrococcales bacterium]